MEAFGVAVSVLTVIEITHKAVFLLYESHRSIKSASDDRKNIIRDLRDLERVLNRILDVVSGDDQRAGPPRHHADGFLEYLESEDSPVKACQEEIAAICDGLKNHRGTLSWPLRKKGIQERLQNVERYKGRLVAAMHASSMETIFAVESILHSQSATLASHIRKESDAAILAWLGGPDVQSNLVAAVEKRQPGTGEWLLQSEPYKHWFDDNPQFLWLTGLPGAGKTVISSTIVATLLQAVRGTPSAVVYFYFDFHAETKREPKALLHVVLSQLAAQGVDVAEELRGLYEECKGGQWRPTMEELLSTARRALGHFPNVYVVVDALDECEEPTRAVGILRSLAEASNAHVIAVSRKNVDLERAMRGAPEIKLEGPSVDADIASYVRQRLLRSEYMQEWPLEVQQRVETLLKSKSESMFRWAQCQLDAIEKCSDSSQIDEALATLPPDLPATYERILANIGPDPSRNVYKVLNCLAFAFRPLTLDEVKNVLQVDPTGAVKMSKKEIFTKPLLSSCSSLVSCGQENQGGFAPPTISPELRLAHFSVKEYLTSDAIAKSPASAFATSPAQGHRSMAEACVACLLHFPSVAAFGPATLEAHPFLLYAARNWLQHARLANRAPSPRGVLDDLIFQLFQNAPGAHVNWLRLYAPDAPSRGVDWQFHVADARPRDLAWLTRTHRARTPLYAAAKADLWRVVEALLRAPGNAANARTSGNRSALHQAAQGACFESMRALLDVGGADIDQGDWVGSTPLHMAVVPARNPEVVEWLLARGANPNVGTGITGTPLQAAAFEDAAEVVEALLRCDRVDPNSVWEHYHGETVTLATALQCAAYVGGVRSMALLLEHGAGLERRGVDCVMGSALHAAALGGRVEAAKMLLERGVSPRLEAGRYGSVLTAAAYGGHRNMVEFLLGCDGVKGDGGKPWADMNAGERRKLVDGIIFEAGERFCPDLLAAAKMGSVRMVRHFIARGADVEKRERFHRRTPLNWAAANGHLEAVKVLAEAGASVRALNRLNQSPFTISCMGGHLEVAKYLLTKDVYWKHRDSKFRTGLMCAEMGGHAALAKFLRVVQDGDMSFECDGTFYKIDKSSGKCVAC